MMKNRKMKWGLLLLSVIASVPVSGWNQENIPELSLSELMEKKVDLAGQVVRLSLSAASGTGVEQVNERGFEDFIARGSVWVAIPKAGLESWKRGGPNGKLYFRVRSDGKYLITLMGARVKRGLRRGDLTFTW